jgi:hypothetical protein
MRSHFFMVKTGRDRWLPIDARIYYDLETHDWQDAANIKPPPASPSEDNFEAYWIETIGAARTGNAQKAEQALELYRKSSAAWDIEVKAAHRLTSFTLSAG